MKRRKRIPWGQVVGTGLALAMGGGCGVVLAGFLDRCPGGIPWPLWALGLAAAFLAAILAQVILHEAGHLVCGLLSGYRFSSFRVGNLMWVKADGRLRLRRLRLAGTGGQCLMSPPDMADGSLPVTLYNFGGALANLLTAALSLLLYGPARDVPLLAAFLLFLAVTGIFMAAMNGIPLRLGGVDNDGHNALALRHDPAALRAFWGQMRVAEAQTRGLRLREMPEDWFWMPGDEELQNPMTAAQGVLVCNRLLDEGRLAEADRTMALLLALSRGLPGLYRGLLLCDRVTVELLGEARPAVLEGFLTREQRKFMGQMKRFPTVLRTRYLHALLAEKDAARAERIRQDFERAARTYPYPADITAERELLALGDAKAAGIPEA